MLKVNKIKEYIRNFHKKNEFYFVTITGQIIFVNLVFFISMLLYDKSLFSPSVGALLNWGASSPVLIAKGQWWRFISANFVHYGFLHFFLNMLALKTVGENLEKALGKTVFFVIYMISGTSAFIASTYLNMSLSSGASGAIFGLIGAGVVIENIYIKHNRRLFENLNNLSYKLKLLVFLKMRPYLFVAILNIILALVLNLLFSLFASFSIRIDNAAHISGMLCGMSLLGFLYFYRTTKSFKRNFGILGFLIFILGIVYAGGYIAMSDYIKQKIVRSAIVSKSKMESIYHLTEAIEIDNSFAEARFRRAVLLLKIGEIRYSYTDFYEATKNIFYWNKFLELEKSREIQEYIENYNLIKEELKKNKGIKEYKT
jgi:rhomboid protease GluP